MGEGGVVLGGGLGGRGAVLLWGEGRDLGMRAKEGRRAVLGLDSLESRSGGRLGVTSTGGVHLSAEWRERRGGARWTGGEVLGWAKREKREGCWVGPKG